MRVIPRLDTAQGYGSRTNFPIYTLLGFLQRDGMYAGRQWTWGPLEGAPYLPRVAHGRVVLRRAEWNLVLSDVDVKGQSRAGAYAQVRALWRTRGIPRCVRLTQHDQFLLIDIEVPQLAELLLKHLKKHGEARLVENYPADDDLLLSSDSGRYYHEVVIPFSRVALPHARMAPRPPITYVRSSIAPSGEWLYLKAYGGEEATDTLLRDVLPPIISSLREQHHIDKWFFVRYADPARHVRLRFSGAADVLATMVEPLLKSSLAALLAEGVVWQVQQDTYKRELGRYGGIVGMPLAEGLFTADSDAALKVRGSCTANGEAVKKVAAVLSVLTYLDDFRLTLADQEAMLRERARDDDLLRRKARAVRYRELRPLFETLTEVPSARPQDLTYLQTIYAERSECVERMGMDWLEACDAAGVPRWRAISSVIHMSLNRLGEGAEAELDTYDHALRVARARAAAS